MDPWQGKSVLLSMGVQTSEINTKSQSPILLPYKDHCIASSRVAGFDGSHIKHVVKVIFYFLQQPLRYVPRSFFEWMGLVTSLWCSVASVHSISPSSSAKTSWNSARRSKAFSLFSGVQDSSPNRSTFLKSFSQYSLIDSY